MSVVGDLFDRYQNMDSVDRQNLWFAVAGVIVVILLIYYLGAVFDMFGDFFSKGEAYYNNSANTVKNLTKIP